MRITLSLPLIFRSCFLPAAGALRKPNIVIILVDDYAYENL
jgi:hypothetical protein